CRVIAGPAESAPIARPPDGRYSLIFLDPPYRLNDAIGPDTVMGRTLHHLAADVPIDPDALLIWRHETHRESPPRLPGEWRLTERRSWGSVAISMFRNCPPADEPS
ncbi:MAG: RsmD family RNA methyltransferase, partial [Dehalococcoidia bacterium]